MDEKPKFAVKELSAVEVRPARSNQHEFNASELRKVLGFEERSTGELSFFFSDDNDVVAIQTRYTIYDAREQHPTRTEWRLYYYGDEIVLRAAPGDLLLIARPSSASFTLHAVVAKKGSRLDSAIRSAFALRDHATLRRFARVTAEGSTNTAQVIAAPILDPHTADFGDLAGEEVVVRAIQQQAFPSTLDMARAAHQLTLKRFGNNLDPDAYLYAVLRAETALFEYVERSLGQTQLTDLISTGADFDQVMKFALSRIQSRKTRRGTSLQNHMETIFQLFGICYTAQCKTEGNERPDFIIPSCAAYQDPSFPSDRLRMVGCKSKLRDRWRQYLAEAERIALKHHICLDEDLTDEVLREMHAKGLRTCMPQFIIDQAYSTRPIADLILNVQELVSELRSVAVS